MTSLINPAQVGAPIIMMKKSGVDGVALAATKIGTTDATATATKFYPLFAIVRVTAANTLAVTGALSIGTNSASYNNILPITTTTGLLAVGQVSIIPLSVTAATVVDASTDIFVKVTTGMTASSATIEVSLVGLYS